MTELNSEQRLAVEHGEGPLLIRAGPGSGKTGVITERIAYLVKHVPGLAPENILALTFTEKAAHVMESRAGKLLGETEGRPAISTFHAFCRRTLDEHGFNCQLLDKVDLWIFLRRRMAALELNRYRKLIEPGAFLHDLNDFFSRCQDELIEPEDFDAYVQGVESDFNQTAQSLDEAERQLAVENLTRLKEVAGAFRSSHRLLQESGCTSLGSLITETLRLWDRTPDALRELQDRFRYVLVDEVQDTNYGQMKLLERLVPPPYNITAVGDEDQAIYRFRGAADGAVEMFQSSFPGARLIALRQNYRSTPRILRVAEAAIAKNNPKNPKPRLETTKEEGGPIFLLHSPDPGSEAAGVAGMIEDLARKGTPYHDIAVLYRAHNYRDELVRNLRRRNISYSIRGLSLLSTPMLRDIVAILRVIHSPHENVSLTRVLMIPRWNFPEELAFEARRIASKDRSSIFQALEGMDRLLFRQELVATGWPELKRRLEAWRYAAREIPMTALHDRLTDELGLKFLPGELEEIYLKTFKKFLGDWEKEASTGKLAEFIEYFDLFLDAHGALEIPQNAQPAHGVQLMTVHAAKGLEFPVVIMLGVAPRRFPSTERKQLIEFPVALRKSPAPTANIHLEEERRLFYVAVTRAEERLYISSVSPQGRKPSAFVQDLLQDNVLRARDIETIELEALDSEEPKVIPAAPTPAKGREKRRGQSNLFDGAPANLHPRLGEWAARPAPIEKDGTLRLSATALDTYIECPLKFKFSHLERIPTGAHAALTFGNIIHQSVRRYFDLRKEKMPTPDEAAAFYLAAWKSAGFEDAYQEEAYKQSGLEQIRGFVEQQNEREFNPQAIRSEQAFEVSLPEATLEGRIDHIEPADAKNPRTVELVDYKTGRPRTQKDADSSLQLSVYALAARECLDLDPVRVAFYNLTNLQAVTSVRSEHDFEMLKARVREVAENIRGQKFPANPGYGCKYCDYVPICPAHEETV